MKTRFKNKSQIIEIAITAVTGLISVATMFYGVAHFGLGDAYAGDVWLELVLNVFYTACIVLMGLYFFMRIDSMRFNYWTSVCMGITVLLRDILFPPDMKNYPVIRLLCLTLSVALLLTLMYFYARKDWKSYTKRNLWLLFAIDLAISVLYTYVNITTPVDESTSYYATEIWIRSGIIYGMVACFKTEIGE